MTRRVLVIDDEPNMRWVLKEALEQAGYTVQSAESGAAALAMLSRDPVDLVLLDLKLRGEDGISVLRQIRERWPEVVVMILTAYGTVSNAVEAMQLGAGDVLRKPFDVEEVLFKLTRALERRRMQQEIAQLRTTARTATALDTLVGSAPAWQECLTQARQLADNPAPVVLLGEVGSGRRSLARAIHVASLRQAAPLVELDLSLYAAQAQQRMLACGAESVWAQAGSGSVLLSHLEDAPAAQATLDAALAERPPRQARLLVVVEERNAALATLRAQLPLCLRVPPLRERPGDILLLTRAFVPTTPITPLAAQLLEASSWPGNVAELRGTVLRAQALAGGAAIDVHHLPASVQDGGTANSASLAQLPQAGIDLEQLEQTLIRQALERTRGNKSKAAALLGLTRHTLVYRLEKYNIQFSS